MAAPVYRGATNYTTKEFYEGPTFGVRQIRTHELLINRDCPRFHNPHEKEAIARILVSELYVDDKSLDFSPMMHLNGFVNRKNAVCDPTGSRPAFSNSLCS
jgi:hypothetical protein